MMSKMMSPRGGGGGGGRHRDDYDDDDRSRSSWSLSHMLDYVQLRGGCRQRRRARFHVPGDGGVATTTTTAMRKRRSWPSMTRRPLLSWSESDDQDDDCSTKIAADLKSRLRSMRRERKGRIFREETRQDEGCDGRSGDGDEDRSKSSWSISNLLDFVQLQGGCRQGGSLTGGGAGLCTGRESGDDGSSTFRNMTTNVAELKSQLRSMRSEQRRSHIPRERTRQEDGFALSLSRGTSSEDRVGEANIPGDSGFDIAIALAKKTLEWDTEQRRQKAESNQYATNTKTALFETPSSPLTACTASRPATSESMRNNFIDPSGKTSVTMNKFMDPPEFMDPPGAMSDVTMMGNSYGMTNGASGNAVGSGGTTGMHQIPTHTMSSGPAPYCQMPQQQTPFPNIYQQQTHQQQMSQQHTPQKEMTHQQLHQHVPQFQQPQQSKTQPQYQQPSTQQNESQVESDIGLGNMYNASTSFCVGAFDGGTSAHPRRSNASPYNPSRVPSRPSPSPSSTPSLSRPSFPGRTNDGEFQTSNKILNELRIKNELIQQDIDRMKKGETGGTGVGPNMPVQLGVQSRQPSTDPILSSDWNELRMKNELIKQDIDRMKKGATGGNSGRFLPTGGGGNAAIGTRVGPTLPFQSVVQSRQPSMTTPTLSPRQRMVQSMQRGGNLPKQEKAQGGEEEVLMSHSDTLKYLFNIR